MQRKNRWKQLRLNVIIDLLKLVICLPISLLCKLYFIITKKQIWIISEEVNEARDNGFELFKYIRENHPQRLVYYAITKDSIDYNKVSKYGNIINFYSFKHWIYYLSASKIIVTQKHSSPSKYIFYILQKLGWAKNRRIFLQHGITMNNVDYLHYKQTKYRLFICAAEKELNYIRDNFGYPKENVQLLGFPRFDKIYNNQDNSNKQIVIMPSWRSYLLDLSEEEFKLSTYYKTFSSLINNEKLIKNIESNNITVYFYPHRNMQKFISLFKSISKNIKIVGFEDTTIQKLLLESSLLITDYSSVSLDFAYSNKPLIYYQFDFEDFKTKQLQPGYFSYENDGFGPVINNEKKLIDTIEQNIKQNFKNTNLYLKRINEFFALHDNENSQRVFEYIDSLDKKGGNAK